MAHVFEGEPDARQTDEPSLPASRFRPRYRALSDDERRLHDRIKDKAVELEQLIDSLHPGRYRALAHTALEEAIMWAIKELTA